MSVTVNKQLNFIVNSGKHVTDLLKDLKISEVISETVYKSLEPRGSNFGILCGLSKVHKKLFDNCAPFRPIMSAIKTPTYNLGKFLILLLEPITTSMNTVKIVLNLPKKLLTMTQEFS